MRITWGFGAGLAALACGGGTAHAASLSVSSSATQVTSGQAVSLTVAGQADRDGSWSIYAQPDGVACGSTVGQQNSGNGGDPLGTNFGGRQNLAAGERFTDPVSFTPGGGSYRFCAYLGDFNQNGDAPPDARAQLVLCEAGRTLTNDRCVAPAPPPSSGGGGSGGGGTSGGGTSGTTQNPTAVEPTNASGDCAPSAKFPRVAVLRVDCADAQSMVRAWRKQSSCVPTLKKLNRTCSLRSRGFSCAAKRKARAKTASVRCTRSVSVRQVVKFTARL